MFVPEFFHGKFSDIEKKLKPLRSRNKTLDAVRNLYDVINQTMSDEACGERSVISLSNDYISRTMTDAYYPFLFSNYITFEEDDDSERTNGKTCERQGVSKDMIRILRLAFTSRSACENPRSKM